MICNTEEERGNYEIWSRFKSADYNILHDTVHWGGDLDDLFEDI